MMSHDDLPILTISPCKNIFVFIRGIKLCSFFIHMTHEEKSYSKIFQKILYWAYIFENCNYSIFIFIYFMIFNNFFLKRKKIPKLYTYM